MSGTIRTVAVLVLGQSAPAQSSGAPKHLVDTGISPVPVVSTIGVILIGFGLCGLVAVLVTGRARRRPLHRRSRQSAAP
jgi:hypothetical protein